jgi:hypothetical protein
MKILYVGTERAEAQAIATAVNSLGERVTVSWTSGLNRVAKWIDENDAPRVLVVDAQPNGSVWRSVLTYAAGLSTALPVVVIVPEEIASDLQPLPLDAHERIARNPSLLRDLPAAITRAIDRARHRQLEQPARAELELKLVQATASLQEVEHRHESAIAAAAEQLARRQSQHEMEMARAAATRDMVNEQFREAGIEVERARVRHGSAVADVERLARRETELSMQLDSATRERSVLERRLADAETALHAGEARAAEERRAVAELFAEREREFERKISQEVDKRRGVEDTLAQALSAGPAAEQRHASAMTAAAIQSRELKAALSAARHEVESKAAHLDARAKEAAERKAELEEQIRQERAVRVALEEQLTDAHAAALREEQQRHDVALAAAVGELAERQAHFDRERAEAETKRSGLTAQLREVEEARDQARSEQQLAAADVTRLTQREAELEGRLKVERETRDALEQEVARAAAALRDEQERHRALLATAASDLAERQANFDRERTEAEAKRCDLTSQLREVEEARDQARREQQSAVADIARLMGRETALEARLKEECETRDVLEQEVARGAVALLDEQERHRTALATAAAELAERQAHFDRERAEAETKCGDLTTQLRETEKARDEARREHESAVGDLTRATEHAAAEREAAAARQTGLEARLSQANEKLDRLQQTFGETRSNALDAERLLNEQIETLRTASLAQATGFDEQRRQHERRLSEAQDINITLTRERLALHESLHTTQDELRLLTAERREINQELQKSRADNHRLFQQAPLPMFRCTKDGVLTQANRMLTMLVGRRSPDELRSADWAAAVFESSSDLSWLIERCLGSKGKESTETAWRRKDGSRLLVRVSACATSSGLIEASVEDLTPIRVLNDRLSQAHRMEAVGRLATEVAVTCGSLLAGVHQNAQQLWVTDESTPASRHRSEMLLDEISRAAGLLRQLAAYGDEESRKPSMVELSTVVRDVAPVLKRVAGDGVEVELPAASAPLNVDAGAERVQRLLVNLAAYGRERMPLGGRLKIELGRTVVDRHFAAKHPNVRLGPHALVTVTESRRATPPDGPLQLHDTETGSNSRSVAVQTRVDLGTLQELVAECGGHLWMTVEPAGDMVVKIRLPLVNSYGEPPRRRFGPGGRVRTLGQWFQH